MAKRQDTDYIIIHCSATPPSMDVGAKEIDKWHRQRGWRKIGYHYVITRDGDIQEGRELDEIGAHCRGLNSTSVGVCLVGGVNAEGEPESNFTSEQWASLEECIKDLLLPYSHAEVTGHNKHSSKACPSFDVEEWWKETIASSFSM